MPELGELITYLLTGSIAGLLAGLLGVGGGLVIVPALVWSFRNHGIDELVIVHLAVGTSLATIIFTSISSVLAHHRRLGVIWSIVKDLAPGIVLGAWLGAAIADLLPTLWLQRVFGIFAVIVGLQMGMGLQATSHRSLPGTPGMLTAGGVIGCISSIVGIGGGSLTVPFLSWCSVEMRRAVGTSSACGLPIAVAGAVGFVATGWGEAALPEAASGYLYWPALAGIVAASFLFAPVGARLAHTLPTRVLKRIFSLLLLVLGIRMVMG